MQEVRESEKVHEGRYIYSGRHVFEIVDSIPKGYEVWSIGKNMVDGYLPLCRLKKDQPYEGACSIEENTLKAIKCEEAQIVLAAFGYGPNSIKTMEQYVKRYGKSKTPYVMRRVQRMKAALEIMYTLKWE